jgi:hypothetical protein
LTDLQIKGYTIPHDFYYKKVTLARLKFHRQPLFSLLICFFQIVLELIKEKSGFGNSRFSRSGNSPNEQATTSGEFRNKSVLVIDARFFQRYACIKSDKSRLDSMSAKPMNRTDLHEISLGLQCMLFVMGNSGEE